MKKITKVLAGFLMVGMLFFSCKNNSSSVEDEKKQEQDQSDPSQNTDQNKPVDEKVEAVTFNVAAGDVEEFTTVTLSSATAGAVIYYAYAEGEAASTLTKENYSSAAKYEAPVEIVESGTLYAIAVKGNKVSEIKSAAYKTVAPADAMRNWTAESTATAYSVYKYADLEKLAEVVNGKNPLAGVTITQKKDIKINESVLGDKFAEPAEAEACKPNADLINFAGIGSRKIPFSGTYDGNKKVISGLYIYGNHQGLGFFGCIKNATVKNVIIVDGCVINSNESGPDDGSDDDRFGGLIGMSFDSSEESEGNVNTVENCIFVGTVGSDVAKQRAYPADNPCYEYIAGIVGRVEKKSTINLTNCYTLVNLNGTSVAALVKSVKGTVNCTDCYGVQVAEKAEDRKVYTTDSKKVVLDAEDGISKATVIEAAKTNCGIDLTDYFTKAGL